MQRVAILLILSFLLRSSIAQVNTNLRVKTIELKSDTTYFDTSTVADFKIISPADFDSLNYTIDLMKACIVTSQRGTITISYRVIFYPFQNVYKHKDRNLIRNNQTNKGPDFVYIPQRKNLDDEDEYGLNKSGVISRGISIGNNQDLVLNSIFNLQLSGKLNSEWNILGSISDDNTQLQPDGSTLQLQEFDKVFIKLYNDNKQITIGDFELKPDVSKSYFINYYKRNRGVYFTSKETLDSTRILHYGGSAAAAKGRYTRQVVQVNDGNQGPYRLKGNNGELYVLINAGTERIYLDDKLLTRGYDNDYTIDYNTGELSFTSKRLIIATSRVVAEFQYTDRNYSRSVINGFAEWQQAKLNVRIQYFGEKDLKNQPVLLELTDAQKQKLASVGDSVELALSPSAKEVRIFTNEKILYRKIDTLGYQNVYVLANGQTSDTIFYEVVFNEVGPNKGNYRLLKSEVNGKVFEFVPPINGELQGNSEPLLPLTAPKNLQNISLGMDYLINKNQKVNIEIAGSKFDKNEFSKKDKNDDAGFAAHTQWEQHYALSKKPKPLELKTIASLDYIHKNFKSIERFRDINFTRIWNRQIQQVSDANSQAMEYNSRFEVQLKKTEAKTFNIGIEQYHRELEQDGLRYNTSLNLKLKKTTIRSSAELMENKLLLLQNTNQSLLWNFYLMQQLTKYYAMGTDIRQETSRFRATGSDSMLIQSYSYLQGIVFAKWDQKNNQLRIDVSRRNDAAPMNEIYKPSFSTNIIAVNESFQLKRQILQLQAQFKTIEIHNQNLTPLKRDQSLTFQLQHGFQSNKNAVQHNLQCNAGSGQEQRRIFTFIEVPTGRGSYTWRDYNSDGIKQLNEFEQAYNPDETRFVRVLIPTQDFTKVNYFAIYETFILQPYKLWSAKKGMRKLASKFENRLTYKNEFKQYAQNNFIVTRLNTETSDTSLINNNTFIENNIIFNHPFNAFDMRYNYRKTGNTSLLTYGLDTRKKFEHELVFRYNTNANSFIQLFLQSGTKQLSSQFFVLRNYRFQYYGVEPRLNLDIKRTLRITLRSKYYVAKEKIILNTQTENIEAGLDLHWYVNSKSFMDGRMSLVNIKFNGDINSTVAYEMLQGLSNGNNILIYLTFLHQISSTMQLNLNYNGRATQGKPMIHTGGIEVRYLF